MYMNETEIRFSAKKKKLFGGSWGGGVSIYIYIQRLGLGAWGLGLGDQALSLEFTV